MSNSKKKLKIAILGSGNIGTDLLVKVLRSPHLECALFIGRRGDSPGMNYAKKLGVDTSVHGIDAITKNPTLCDLVFDATNAKDHLSHWAILKKLGKIVIDMTPSRIGGMIIPSINLDQAVNYQNVNMVSCGGQASISLVHALAATHTIRYIEVVVSIASRSAGKGTRINIDEYIENTENGIRAFTKCPQVKTILILNPAQPDIDMQASISLKIDRPDLDEIKRAISEMEKKIQTYVPGFTITVAPVLESNRVFIMAKVQGLGDYLPRYAGNLDIINCAAIATAEAYAKVMQLKKENGRNAYA
jgi:acetaldehyde dehydrogenase